MENKWSDIIQGTVQSKADYLIDGEQYFESVVSAMEKATTPNDFIYILGWMLDVEFQLYNGKNKTLFHLLNNAAEKGVEIRILVWDNLIPANYKTTRRAIELLQNKPNTKIFLDSHTFFPQKSKAILLMIAAEMRALIDHLYPTLIIAGIEKSRNIPVGYVLDSVRDLSRNPTIGAHHEKVVIVKGNNNKLVAFCGGLDFNTNRIRPFGDKDPPRFPYYHDTACRVEGPAAYDILEKFKRRWKNHPTAKTIQLLGENYINYKPSASLSPSHYVKVVGTYNSVDGRQKDRSLKKDYMKIIKNAKNYIYIEDQYLINLEVAEALNEKIRDKKNFPNFQKIICVIQDSIETSDILIPNRKRDDFIKTVLKDATPSEAQKVQFAMIDRTNWEKGGYHPGMHAKTLIVDDEIAIIGSANVNQRSFTCDSETSVIVFDEDPEDPNQNFARLFRIDTWKDFERISNINPNYYDSWYDFPTEIMSGSNRSSMLIPYSPHLQEDLDVRIKHQLTRSRKASIFDIVWMTVGGTRTSIHAKNVLLLSTVDRLFAALWENFFEVKVPD